MFLQTTTVKHTNTPFFSIPSGAKLSIWQLGTLWKIKLMENLQKIKFLGGGDIVKCCCSGCGADHGAKIHHPTPLLCHPGEDEEGPQGQDPGVSMSQGDGSISGRCWEGLSSERCHSAGTCPTQQWGFFPAGEQMAGPCRAVLKFVCNQCFGFYSLKKKGKKAFSFVLIITLVTLSCSSNSVPAHVPIVQPMSVVFLLLSRQSNFWMITLEEELKITMMI